DRPGARVVQLTRNYRSTRVIVAAALQSIAPSTLVTDRRLVAHQDGDARGIELVDTATERPEAELVVETIEGLVGGTSFFSLDSGRVGGAVEADLGFSDFAVLYRTESQAGPLCEALARSGIPFQRRAHGRIAEQPGVSALVEAMERQPAGGSVAARLAAAFAASDGADGASLATAMDLLAPL